VQVEFTAAVVAIGFVGYALVSRRLDRSPVTGTIVFTALGLLIGPELLGLADLSGLAGQADVVRLVLVATLVVVLFSDASAINSAPWHDDVIPARLLGIGLPVMIALGWVGAALVFDGLEFWEAAVLATMLAPTDAALGKAVVSNPRVPRRIRQALNVESGLNDGIALPVFVVFVEAAIVAEGGLPVGELAAELVRQVGTALAVGVAVGWIGAKGVAWARRRETAERDWLQIGVVALAGAAYAVADPLGGSGFIAAWVAGFAFGRSCRAITATGEAVHEFAETTGAWLTMASFLLFGIYLGPVLVELTWSTVLYGGLTLVVFRLVSVGVAMLGSGLAWRSVLYLGWFGPRGLATLILSIEILELAELDGATRIADAALFAVGLSVLAHGVTAWWGSNAYADAMERHPAAGSMVEDAPTTEVPMPRRFEHPMS
jgi:sodium/hydrogen antiporter